MVKDQDKLRERIGDLEEKWKRAVADYRNLERRVKKEREEFLKFANSVLILKLLPVLDGLEKAAEQGDEGIKLVLKQLRNVLESEGVVKIEALGKEFDTETMEAVESEVNHLTTQPSNHTVIEVLQKGYRMGDRVLRVARVRVGNKSVTQ